MHAGLQSFLEPHIRLPGPPLNHNVVRLPYLPWGMTRTPQEGTTSSLRGRSSQKQKGSALHWTHLVSVTSAWQVTENFGHFLAGKVGAFETRKESWTWLVCQGCL